MTDFAYSFRESLLSPSGLYEVRTTLSTSREDHA